jgi:RNA-directed DNA polymerase
MALTPLYRPPHSVHGYVPKRNIQSNAIVHAGQLWVLGIDLENFFPSINFGRVRGLFMAHPFNYAPHIATLLAQICCHDNQLPQGAPTSPLLSNLILRGLDRDLAQLARAERCYYSRYCDDITFSTNRRAFPPDLATVDHHTGNIAVGEALRGLFKASGFNVNDAKTRLRRRNQRQMVTGLITNEFVNVPRRYIRSVRSLLYIWRRYGEADALARLQKSHPKNRPPDKSFPELRYIVRGKVQYIGSIKSWYDPVYKALGSRLAALDGSFRLTQRDTGGPPVQFHIYAEGKTDYIHLDAAIKSFQRKGEFPELTLRFQRPSEKDGGDSELLNRCKYAAKLQQRLPTPNVFIFDRDNLKILPDVTDSDGGPKDWGNNVFSLAIPVPPHRTQNEPLCIELLYTDEILKRTDSQNRRLYRKSEFIPESGMHVDGIAYCTNPRSGALIRDDDVFGLLSGQKIALSKKCFADLIAAGTPPFDSVSFDGFTDLFKSLQQIRRKVLAH